MVEKSDKIIVSSIKVKNELISMFPPIKNKIFVLPFGIPFDMTKSKQNKKQKYFLYVGMNHPIKNISFIKKAFKKFNTLKDNKNHRLVLVTKNCSRKKLLRLYRNASALLTASYYESFNFPVLEALSQGCPVVGLQSAIIPEFKQYVNTVNNIEDFVRNMKKLIIKPTVQSINQLDKKFNWKI